MESTKSNDVYFMNYMKFIGIIYLLIYHAGIRQLNIFVILFFLQMFVFISGYFYKDGYTNKPVLFIIKRIKSLYIPFVVYCSLFVTLNNLFVRLGIYTGNMLLDHQKLLNQLLLILKLQTKQPLAGALWFVSALFITSILFCIISYVINIFPQRQREFIRFFVISSLFLMGNYLSILKIIWDPFVDVSFVLLLFFYSGYLYKKYENLIPMNFFMALSAFLLLILCTRYGIPRIPRRIYISPAFLLVCSLAGAYLNIYISRKLTEMKKIEFINFVGRNTLAILALHLLAFKFVNLLVIYICNLPTDQLSSFPFIKSTNQYWRWMYILAGLTFPLVMKLIYDFGQRKVLRLFRTIKS